jgi:hypothetical protein
MAKTAIVVDQINNGAGCSIKNSKLGLFLINSSGNDNRNQNLPKHQTAATIRLR